jgi:triacylglycerol lipase
MEDKHGEENGGGTVPPPFFFEAFRSGLKRRIVGEEARMYYPPGYRSDLAIELGELVAQAYAQHDAHQAGGDWNLSGDYRQLGALVCEPKRGRLPAWLKPGNKDGPLPIGFVARRKKAVYVIFRGTATSGEWTKNMSFNLTDYPLTGHGMAHVGFLDIYQTMRESLFAALAAVKGSPKLYLAGHSLGGALATLAAPEIEARTALKIAAIYTFGSPRTGDDDFVQAYNKAFARLTFRIANNSDLIPSVPLPIPIGMGGYFSHVDTPVEFTAQLSSIEKNHEMATYLERLRLEKRRTGFFSFFRR